MRVFMSAMIGGGVARARSWKRWSSTFWSSAFAFASLSSLITEGSSCIRRILPCTRLLKGFLRTELMLSHRPDESAPQVKRECVKRAQNCYRLPQRVPQLSSSFPGFPSQARTASMGPEARSLVPSSSIISRSSSNSAARLGMLWMSEHLAIRQIPLLNLFQRLSLPPPRLPATAAPKMCFTCLATSCAMCHTHRIWHHAAK
mmetsp:Transcript_17161/g.42718  ORF Transcript_17161/g.42718 Transcript_17161/m.42718 type:complete len:202 (-) Transcript_17161:383-988(-)